MTCCSVWGHVSKGSPLSTKANTKLGTHESHSYKGLHSLRCTTVCGDAGQTQVHFREQTSLPSAGACLETLCANTGLGIAMLPEIGEWVVETVCWPPRLILSCVAPESHSCRDLCSLEGRR